MGGLDKIQLHLQTVFDWMNEMAQAHCRNFFTHDGKTDGFENLIADIASKSGLNKIDDEISGDLAKVQQGVQETMADIGFDAPSDAEIERQETILNAKDQIA